MLKSTEKPAALSKEEYKALIEPLRQELSRLQHRVREQKLPVLVVFEGWAAAGKGSLMSDVILALDPRNFKTRNTLAPTPEEKRYPFLWRHWAGLPEAGLFGIYDNAWYPEVSSGRVTGRLSNETAYARMDSINTMERQLVQDGTLILKFFLHISQKEQKKRFDKLAAKKSTAWRVDQDDYRHNQDYAAFFSAYEEMLAYTHTAHAPWHVVPSKNRRGALVQIYRILVDSITAALQQRQAPKLDTGHRPLSPGEFTLVQMPALREIHLNQQTEPDEYKERLKELQARLSKLHNLLYLRKIPLVIAYEGWDAAGKGGNIRRLTGALDPRGYEVIPIASPTPPEKAHHYLWRFWQRLPKNGHIAIFDRTWYGRVLVERVEGFATPPEWGRAYREINEFEAELADWGAVIVKFWLHISKEEQLRRFEARQDTPDKQWKITGEDWRNREKWDEYQAAVNDMLRLTSSVHAPWTIIESENKRYGRIKALETVIEAIRQKL